MSTETFNKFVTFLKTIRFGWVVPFILLMKGEDPKAQLKAIGTGTLVPVLAIVAFMVTWSVCSKQIVTKFGTVPGPSEVWSAWGSLQNEMRLEGIKKEDHERRSRERRITYFDKYAEVLKEIPGDAPDVGDAAATKAAMETLAKSFDEADELLEVANKLTVLESAEEAKQAAAEFKFDSSKELGDTIIAQLLPLEISYRKDANELRTDAKYVAAADDSESVVAEKETRRKSRERELAAEKATLLITRQKLMTKATKVAAGVVGKVPGATRKTLADFDAKAAILGPRLTAWLADLEATEAAGGAKFKDKVKVKLLTKQFEDKPYPGKDTYIAQIMTSLKTVFAGFLVASLVAIPIGILCGLNPTINNAFNPLIQIFKPVSPLAWLPIVMIVVGALYITDDPKFEISFVNSAITVALCSLWPTLVNTAMGVATTDKDYLNVARVLKLSWFKQIFKVVLPAALPLIFTGLRLSLGVGWMVLIAAEMLAQNPGLGKFVWDMFQNGSSETLSMILVAVFTIGIIGFLLDTVMLSLQKLVSFGEAI